MALTDKLSAIADAIRAKTGKSDSMTLEQMPTEIASITGGGSGGGSADGLVTVTFMNGDVELFSRPVYIGDDCPEPVAQGRFDAPTKESTAQYSYTFYGWGASDGGAADANILKNIRADKTVYAVFAETARLFNITFYDDNGTTVLATKQFGYGTIPNYTPTKAGYMFGGWNPKPVPVTGDASYTVVWTTQLASGTSLQTTWRLYTNGTLRISGTGEPQWYNKTGYTSNPLYQYRTQIKEVIIEEGVTGIPSYYFYKDYDAIESITLADSVISLGAYSLYSCGALKSINFPDNLQTIGDYALYACVELTSSIDIPNSVTSIGEKAFMLCKKVASITIGNGVTSLPYYCFAECYALESITIPANITELPQGGFNKCTSLASVTFQGAITQIGAAAFASNAITTITIPASVTVIGRSAFYGCPLASAYFENPNGWTVNGTATAATDLADPATAASLLVQDTYWSRS